ncbi:A24 family peptidase [Tsukamurella paurometabola]|uniref:Flp pilus assembly protein, protease CpaA n=1 Tax=Tsukamurella paurometabola TaxID=2061 RepID=A0A3P8K6H2_TSUPA|nr:A24 family peptidase [Tsukamurella paurometabola]MBS4099814.1 prepilin peptidase [Tsukamurella paurometabola]UEA83813.1 A24 family peptidase [Tsukamurella paurometabola]VDR40959.1 Flp pilus assembly protein, protease CpaA [Tsukamurella paurometabola]
MEWGLFGGALLAWCAALCWFDVRERRLPNVLTLPAACVAVLGSLGAWFDGAPAPLVGAVLWTAVNGAAFLARGMGAGDVKLAPALGAVVAGAGGVPAVLLAILGAQLLTVAWALAARDRTVPHGPPMIAAALVLSGLAVTPW